MILQFSSERIRFKYSIWIYLALNPWIAITPSNAQDNPTPPVKVKTSRTLESIFGTSPPQLDSSLPWSSEMSQSRGIFSSEKRRVVWCSDPESKSAIFSIPFIGKFDISAKLDVEKLPGSLLDAGFVCIWNKGKSRHSVLRTANGNIRVRNDFATGENRMIASISPALLEKHPWVRVRNFNGQVTVFISADGFFWKERVKFPTPSDRGRVGLAVFGNPELGPRCGVIDDLHLTVVSTKNQILTVQPDRMPNDADRDNLPDDFVQALQALPKAKRSLDGDADGDGVSNWAEYLAHTSMTDSGSRPSQLPGEPRSMPGMELKKWPFPPSVHTISAITSIHPDFPLGAQESLVIASLEKSHFTGKPTVFRLTADFSPANGGFYEFQLAGIRNGQLALQELHLDPSKHSPHPKEIVLAVNAAQRFGSGSVFLKRDRFYRLELLALHRDENTVPQLNWVRASAPTITVFSPEKCFVPPVNPSDLDRDGLPDQWEDFGIGHRFQGPFDDADLDRLPNIFEWLAGSDPLSKDTDGDDISDLIEESLGRGLIDPAIKPIQSIPASWRFSWIAPEQKPRGKKDFLPQPKPIPVLFHDDNHHHLLAQRHTYRGNRVGWVPFLYRELKGDFDVMTLVDFPFSSKEMTLFRSAAGGLMVRKTTEGNSRFEISFSVSNSGELMIKHVPDPSTGINPYYENQYGGDSAWKHQQLWLRLIRRGNMIVSAWSPDREVWIQTSDPLRAVSGPLLLGTFALGGSGSGESAVRFSKPEFFDPDQFAHPVYDKHIQRWNDIDRDADNLKDREERDMGVTSAGLGSHQVTLTKVADIVADKTKIKNGKWVSGGERGIFCQEGHGTLDFPLEIESSGLYRALVETAPSMNYGGTGVVTDQLAVDLDGKHLDTLTIQPRPDGMSEFPVILPALDEGTHTLSLRYFSPRAARSLPIKKVRIEKISIAEVRTKKRFLFGQKTVSEDKTNVLLEKRNQLPSGQIESAVSPAFIEGKALFPAWVTGQDSDREGLNIQVGISKGWFANVPLRENENTQVIFRAENGNVTSDLKIAWKPTNILDGGKIILRKGDSLRLIAESGGSSDYQIAIGEEQVTAAKSDSYVVKFDRPGINLVTATAPGKSQPDGLLQVEVVDAKFDGEPVALTGRRRTWTNPQLDLAKVTLTTDPEISLQPLSKKRPGSFSLALSAARSGTYRVQARLPSGVIAAQTPIRVVSIYQATETSIDRVNLGKQGRMMSLQWAVPDVPQSLRLQVRLIAGTGLFDDGSIVKTLTRLDLNSANRMGINALQPVGETRALCHHVYVFDGDHYVGSL